MHFAIIAEAAAQAADDSHVPVQQEDAQLE